MINPIGVLACPIIWAIQSFMLKTWMNIAEIEGVEKEMIKLDITKQDLKEQIIAVERRILTAKSAYENIMLFQTKNKQETSCDFL